MIQYPNLSLSSKYFRSLRILDITNVEKLTMEDNLTTLKKFSIGTSSEIDMQPILNILPNLSYLDVDIEQERKINNIYPNIKLIIVIS